ncbi:hypothetical protein BaRGS_00020018 [Batillaria attramentaria]|uniref:Homeobox domain-containing protein n=1 Tax=Batillaria attramentaria TaxID=370345 RepID=A0ABD0KP73_9CAEN
MKMSVPEPSSDDQSQSGQLTSKYPDYCRTLSFTDSNGVLKELVFPKALDLDRPKRARTTFSRDQLERLEAEFSANQYLVGRERNQLAKDLGLSETQVKVWFQNRRTKHKRDKERQAEQREAKAESLATQNLLHLLQPPANHKSPSPPKASAQTGLRNVSLPPAPQPGVVPGFGVGLSVGLPVPVPEHQPRPAQRGYIMDLRDSLVADPYFTCQSRFGPFVPQVPAVRLPAGWAPYPSMSQGMS